ncbi:hypothetical protein G6L09_05690 [Agrobacterium rhizogenes]|nr:hypothetical protein [Rhizobium rhizogenes]NTH70050.1 hypothetical protein [Rhizobium rhizogenes]
MSDDVGTNTRPGSLVHFEHWCDEPGCKAWGSLGYDLGKDETCWYCFEHKWTEYPKPKGGTKF